MKSEIKRGTILGYLEIVIRVLIAFFYTPIMLRLMGNSEYGLYSLVSSVTAYLSVLDMGFGNAIVRYVSKYKSTGDKKSENKINGMFLILYSIIGLITIIIGLIILAKIDKLFPALTPEELKKAKIIMMILVGTIAVSFPLGIFDSYVVSSEKFQFLKILNILKEISIPAVMLPLLFMGYKAIALVIVTCTFNILYHVFTMIYSFKKLDMHISINAKEFDFELLKNIYSYSFFVFLGLIVDTVFNNTDQVILGSVCGTTAVSIYSVASKITQINTSCSTTISGLFLPKITKMLKDKDKKKKISDVFIKVSRIQIYIMVLIASGFVTFGRQFINLWVGKEYIDAYYITLILIIPSIVPLTQNIGISVIQAKGIHQFRAIVYLIIAVLNVGISIPLAKAYQGIGAAIGTAIANLLGQIITMNIFYYYKAKLDIPQYWKNMLGFLIRIIPISLVFIKVNKFITFNWFKLILMIILYAIAYVGITYTYMNKEEKNYVKSIIKKINSTKEANKNEEQS